MSGRLSSSCGLTIDDLRITETCYTFSKKKRKTHLCFASESMIKVRRSKKTDKFLTTKVLQKK